eukprot:TRINITY_DN32850_c0_g2_i1.p1 TRINITY_DN32850_c0_g2~~TRINITY_DN32850_c0_g2_i1.p1  ORF type:complete len:421 (+),score=70.62 TRINITY_DN32850_c0_g2_i1:86-1348(+)
MSMVPCRWRGVPIVVSLLLSGAHQEQRRGAGAEAAMMQMSEMTQRQQYNATLFWRNWLIVDPIYGPTLTGVAWWLTFLLENFGAVMQNSCFSSDGRCPRGTCLLPELRNVIGQLEALVAPRLKEIADELEDVMRESHPNAFEPLFQELKNNVKEVASRTSYFGSFVQCEPTEYVEGYEEVCVPVKQVLHCQAAVSFLSQQAMSRIHVAQIAVVAPHREDIGVHRPPGCLYSPGPGMWRSDILTFHLSAILEEKLEKGQAAARLTMAEVGVNDGRTSERLLKVLPNLKLILVDPFEHADDEYWNTEAWEREERVGLADSLWQLTAPFRNRTVIIAQRSSDAVDMIAEGSLDLVFIDGDHAYDAVSRDLLEWLPKVRPGGILAGHDYSLGFPDVVRAAHEFTEKTGLQLVIGGADCFWFHVV